MGTAVASTTTGAEKQGRHQQERPAQSQRRPQVAGEGWEADNRKQPHRKRQEMSAALIGSKRGGAARSCRQSYSEWRAG